MPVFVIPGQRDIVVGVIDMGYKPFANKKNFKEELQRAFKTLNLPKKLFICDLNKLERYHEGMKVGSEEFISLAKILNEIYRSMHLAREKFDTKQPGMDHIEQQHSIRANKKAYLEANSTPEHKSWHGDVCHKVEQHRDDYGTFHSNGEGSAQQPPPIYRESDVEDPADQTVSEGQFDEAQWHGKHQNGEDQDGGQDGEDQYDQLPPYGAWDGGY